MPPEFFGIHHLYSGIVLILIGFIIYFRARYKENRTWEVIGIIISSLGTMTVLDDQLQHFFHLRTPIRILTELLVLNLPWLNNVFKWWDKLFGKRSRV